MNVSTSDRGQSGAAPKPELGIRFSWVNRYGTDYIEGRMVQFGQPRYRSDEPVQWHSVDDSFEAPYRDLCDFEVQLLLSEQTYSGKVERNVYRSAEYRSVYTVDLERAKGMVRVLDRLQRGRKKIQDADGYDSSDGQFVVRLGRVLGVQWLIFDSTLASPFSGNEEQHRLDATGIRAIDHVVRHWQETGRNVRQEQRDEEARRA
jgi:hypothetical protein